MKMKKLEVDTRIHDTLKNVVNNLCEEESYKKVYHRANHETPMPSIDKLGDIVERLRMILLPGYFGHSEITPDNIKFYTGAAIDRVFKLLLEQINRGFCFACIDETNIDCYDCEVMAKNIAVKFFDRLPEIRRMLALDALAAYEGDPAALSIGETIFCYPSVKALTNHRIAHELYKMNVPLIPRIISELAHSETGIDIHPGAKINEKFFIDHGSGTVIGETCVIGKNVRIYQGVTLGAKSFPCDENGTPIKGVARHPIVEDHVIVYSGATILGRITIGKNSEVGGNVWLTKSIEPNTKVMQGKVELNYI